MKKVKKLIENKGLINTFKKIKLRIYLNKSFLAKNKFYLNKFKSDLFFKKPNFRVKSFLYVDNNIITVRLNNNDVNFKLLNTLSYFIILYIYENI